MPEKPRLRIAVDAEAMTWMTVLGCVQLALRHPGYNGPSSDIAREFSDALAHKLLDEGVFSAEEFALMMRDQMRAENSERDL
jgi:hypothetical protein